MNALAAPNIAEPFTLPHFRTWASDLLLDTGESWHPEDFQEWFVDDLFAGFPEAWLIVPEGNTKTTTLAGLALYHCEFRPFAVVLVAAASREQAEIVYRQAEGFVLRSESLYASVHSHLQVVRGKRKTEVPRFVCLEGYRRINHHAGGRIQVMAAEDRTGDGVIPTLGIIDEPHRQRDLSLYRTWSGKLIKRDGQLAAISTAGQPGSDFELTRRQILDTADEIEHKGSFTRAVSERVVLHQWALPETEDPDDIAAVKRANPFSGITEELLTAKHDSPTMTRHHWLRFVCNRPTMDVEGWLGDNGPTIWEGLTDPYTLVPRSEATWAGVDIGLKRDTSAVVLMQKRPDGRFHATCRIWVPRPDRPVDVTDVMKYLRDANEKYALEAVSYDNRFFDVPAKMLLDEGLPMFEVPQSVERMTAAYGSLYEAILDGKISHDRDDAFTTQVLNPVARWHERSFMLDKQKSSGKIDAATALALAYDQALRHESDGPSVYETRELVSV